MADLSSILTFVAILAFFLALAAAGLYLYKTAYPEKKARKLRRLSFVEQTHLDGGRKLLLVRRDDVEHLILIGGPIDLIVETGIRPETMPSFNADEASEREVERVDEPDRFEGREGWKLKDFPLASRLNIAMPALRSTAAKAEAHTEPPEPRLPASLQKDNAEDNLLELTSNHEAKTLT